MSEPFVFDPRCDACKTPYGAVPLGTAVSLRVRPLEAEGFTDCVLIRLHEFAGEQLETPLVRQGPDGDRRRFSVTFAAPETPELVWYWFRSRRADGSVR